MSKKGKEPRCIHRHTINEHPKCFEKGLLNNVKVEEKPKNEKDPAIWYADKRIGYLDIETDNLNADFGTMLSWCIKEKNGPVISSVVTKEELFDGRTDSELVRKLVDTMRSFDIICGYYSSGFDIPYIRAKALHYGYDFPSFEEDDTGKLKPELYHWDVYYLVRSKLKISRKSLESACDYLGIKGKTPLDKDIWRKAKYGDPEAIAKVLEHNIGDVVILEKLHNRLTEYKKWIKSPL
jgi:uncharacterized protein YprB with RNaseH-like and TPR domain